MYNLNMRNKKVLVQVSSIIICYLVGCSPGVMQTPSTTPILFSTLTSTFTSTPTRALTETPIPTSTSVPSGVIIDSPVFIYDAPKSGTPVGQLEKGEYFTLIGQYNQCSELYITSNDTGTTGWISGYGFEVSVGWVTGSIDYLRNNSVCELITPMGFRPETGASVGGFGVGNESLGLSGRYTNRIEVYNQSTYDCVLVLQPGVKPYEWVYGHAEYIRSGENDQIRTPGNGSILVAFTLGNEWLGNSFKEDALYVRLLDPLIMAGTSSSVTVYTLTITETLGEEFFQIDAAEFQVFVGSQFWE